MVTVMVMNDLLSPPLFNVNRPFHSEITAIHKQGYVCGQKLRANFRPWVQSICLLSFRGNRIILGWGIANSIFDVENLRSRSWTRSNTMVTLEALSSIDMLAFNFVAIEPFLAGIYQIPYLTPKIQGQCHNENRPKSKQVIYGSGPIIVPKLT